ncbi:hypothetical protein HDU81_009354 [Chytriomyces hyalinus]|nr:hypothetical protein HDU81_009354 [Chytriomyces hyalinus]
MSRHARVDETVSTANKENDWTPKNSSKAKAVVAKPALSAISSNVQQPSKNQPHHHPTIQQSSLKNSATKLRLMDSPRLSPLGKANMNASFDAMRSGFSFDFGSALVDSSTYISTPLRTTHAQTLENKLNGDDDDEDPFGFFKADRDFDRFLKATANKSGTSSSTSVSLQHQHQQQNISLEKQETNIVSPKLSAVLATGPTQQQNILSSPSQKSISVSTDSSPMAPGQKKRVAWYEKSQSPAPKPKTTVPKKKSVSKPKAKSKAATIETDESRTGGVLARANAVGHRKRSSRNVVDRVEGDAAAVVEPARAKGTEVLETEDPLQQPDEEIEKDTRPKKRQKKVVPVVANEETPVGRVTRSRARKQ